MASALISNQRKFMWCKLACRMAELATSTAEGSLLRDGIFMPQGVFDKEHQSTVGGRPLLSVDIQDEDPESFDQQMVSLNSLNVKDTCTLHFKRFKVEFHILPCCIYAILPKLMGDLLAGIQKNFDTLNSWRKVCVRRLVLLIQNKPLPCGTSIISCVLGRTT